MSFRDHHLAAGEIRRREAVDGRRAHVERRLGPDAERPRQEEIRIVRGAARPDDDHGDHLARRDDEVEGVVGRQVVRRYPDGAVHRRVAEGHGREIDRRRPALRQIGSQRLHLPALHLQGHVEVGDGRRPPIRQSRRHLDPLASREVLAREEHARHAHVVGVRVVLADPDRRHRGPLREADAGGALDAGPLEVADEHRLESRQVRPLEDPLGQLQRRTEPGDAGPDLGVGHQPAQGRPIQRRARAGLRAAVEQDERGAVVGRQVADDVEGRVLRLLPPVAVAHAVRAVEEHHHLARALGHRGQRRRAEEGAREGQQQQEQRGAAQQQEEPVPDALPAERMEGDLPHEHQRRKLDVFLSFALDHVDDDRYGDRHQPEQEQRRQQTHQRTRFSFSRIARNLNSP